MSEPKTVYDKITPEQKKKWVEDLRSGAFKQGKGRLCLPSKQEYCCLGVLAKGLGTLAGTRFTAAHEYGSELLLKVQEQCYLLSEEMQDILTVKNDGRRSNGVDGLPPDGLPPETFQQIADFIEHSEEI